MASDFTNVNLISQDIGNALSASALGITNADQQFLSQMLPVPSSSGISLGPITQGFSNLTTSASNWVSNNPLITILGVVGLIFFLKSKR